MGKAETPEQRTAIVVPIYNDWRSFYKLAEALRNLDLPKPWLIVVDDGSSENGPDLALLTRSGLSGEVLRLRRNIGYQVAIAVGLCRAVSGASDRPIVVMDGDGEDRPGDVGTLLAALSQSPVAVAERARRHASLGFRIFYRLYGTAFRTLTGRYLGFGNFCALSASALRRLIGMPELTLHVAATILRSGLTIQRLPIDRGPRYDGQSKMNFVDLTSHGLRSVAVFGETVLTRIVIAAFLLAAAGALVLAPVLIVKLLGFASPGWATTVAGVVIIIVAQIAMTGLLGLFVILRGQRVDQPDNQSVARSLIDRIERFGEA
jgi:polyisoprenyl-phosphate glycosyltransferase